MIFWACIVTLSRGKKRMFTASVQSKRHCWALSFSRYTILYESVCIIIKYKSNFHKPRYRRRHCSSYRNIVTEHSHKIGRLAQRNQENVSFLSVFGRLNSHSYRRCWNWDPCESVQCCARGIVVRYTLCKKVILIGPIALQMFFLSSGKV